VKKIKQIRLITTAANVHSCFISDSLCRRTLSAFSRSAFFCKSSRISISTGSDRVLVLAGCGSTWLLKPSSRISSGSPVVMLLHVCDGLSENLSSRARWLQTRTLTLDTQLPKQHNVTNTPPHCLNRSGTHNTGVLRQLSPKCVLCLRRTKFNK